MSPSRAPVFSCAHHFQAPATQAIHFEQYLACKAVISVSFHSLSPNSDTLIISPNINIGWSNSQVMRITIIITKEETLYVRTIILWSSTIRNVWRTVRRRCMLMFRLKGFKPRGASTKDAWGHGQKGASSRVLFLLLGLKKMEMTAMQDNQY